MAKRPPSAKSADVARLARIVTRAADARLLVTRNTIVAASKESLSFFQRSAPEIIGAPLSTLLTPACVRKVGTLAASALRSGAMSPVSLDHHRRTIAADDRFE